MPRTDQSNQSDWLFDIFGDTVVNKKSRRSLSELSRNITIDKLDFLK